MLSQTDLYRRGKTDAEIKQQWEEGYRELKGVTMQGSYASEDVEIYIGGRKVEATPFECKDEPSLPLLATIFIMVSNQNGSVKIPLSQETIKELKEKGFI